MGSISSLSSPITSTRPCPSIVNTRPTINTLAHIQKLSPHTVATIFISLQSQRRDHYVHRYTLNPCRAHPNPCYTHLERPCRGPVVPTNPENHVANSIDSQYSFATSSASIYLYRIASTHIQSVSIQAVIHLLSQVETRSFIRKTLIIEAASSEEVGISDSCKCTISLFGILVRREGPRICPISCLARPYRRWSSA